VKFLPAFLLAILFVSCLSDEEQQKLLNADSPVTAEETGIDTFIVAKGQNILSNETAEGDSLRAENDSAIDNIRIAITGSQTPEDEEGMMTTTIVRNPDVGPSFPGGATAMDVHIRKHLIYPAVAFQNDITGTVNVRFVVETDGRLTGIVAQNSIGFGCDESAVDLIKGMPKWTPGKKGGVNVRCSVVLPITFTRPE
jgi:periplasmic protein TonB